MMGMILADTVYTPARAHVRWGVAEGRTLCGAAQGYWLHCVNSCPHTTGNVPARWLQTPGSREVEAEDSCGREDAVAGGCGEVAKDGSNIGGSGVRRASWGLYWGAGDGRNTSGAVIGWGQTAARAEASLTVADNSITIVTDNKGV